MSKQRELGVFEALAIVLVIMGLLALAANALGFLPHF
jgi:hypothetical protein